MDEGCVSGLQQVLFYEIVILNYFMNFSYCDMVFCTLDGKPIRAETFRRLIQRKSMRICRI